MEPDMAALLRGWADIDELEPLTVPKAEGERPTPWRIRETIEGPESIDPASVDRPPSQQQLTLHLVVLLGVGSQPALLSTVKRHVDSDPDREARVRPSGGDCFSAAVAVDVSTGRPVPMTLVVSHLVMLTRRLRMPGVEVVRALVARHRDIEVETRWLTKAAGRITDTAELWAALFSRWRAIAASFDARGNNEMLIGEWTRPGHDPEVVALESFFAPALRTLVQAGHVNDTLARYLVAVPGTEPPGAVDVGQPDAQRQRLPPGSGPLGRWPLRRGDDRPSDTAVPTDLTTSQRVAVVRISERLTEASGIVAINGPPGTGKSTLLREFVAQQVVQRAARIVELGPDDALPVTTMRGRRVFGVAPSVAGFEIVVAAANNRPVENVAKVLNGSDAVPDDIGRTHLAGPGVAWNTEWWALVAAILGNRRNRQRAMKVLVPRTHDPWPGWLSAEVLWPEPRQSFLAASARVQHIAGDVARRAERIGRARAELPRLTRFDDEAALLGRLRQEEAHRTQAVVDHRATRPGWFARQLGTRRWVAWASNHEEACARRDVIQRLLAELIDDPSPPWAGVLDGGSWRAIDDEAVRERCPPGVNTTLEHARAELFIEALNVHGAALAARSQIVGSTLSTWEWSLDAPSSFTPDERRRLWRAAFIVIPVVTTTFASAGRMLGAFGLDELGSAVIDEAGQAAAHQAVPLLSKVRRALIVGDQHQLEPVVTLEHTVGRAVMRAAAADERLTPDQASVQHLADAGSIEGTRITVGTDATWVGMPLRGHFRCADPMFCIANTISYGGTMVRLREAAPSRPGRGGLTTQWIDVPLASGRHWGPDDERALVDLLGRFDEPPDDLFVIAPFRDAIHGARDATKRMVRSRRAPAPLDRRWRDWADDAIGTVHTFQGREADTVILLLSAAAERPRARAWVAKPPNLLNVAVTRAREHLIVIGNRIAWSSEPFASEIAKLVHPHGRSDSASPWPPPVPAVVST